jgi:O-antigen/teichoic acid export membrane protein
VLRNGHFLTMSSVATAAIGLFYWSLTAHRYNTTVVGRSSAVISAMMLIGGVAQLNLITALARFVPVAGVRTRRLVVTSYAVAAALAAALAIGFVAVAPTLSSQFRFIAAQPLMAVGVVVSSAAWAVFVLQDSVLTGLRRAALVAVENAVFSVIKVVAVVVLATVLLVDGILVSWWIGLAVSVTGTNLYLFRRALRRHGRESETGVGTLSLRTVARFAGPDYVGGLGWLAVTSATPLLVLASVGATETAYFAIAWQFAIALFALSGNMGASLMVETATDQTDLAHRSWRVVRHSLLPLGAAVALIEVGAPSILRVFGPAYAGHTAGLLRLLALAAIPNLMTETAVYGLRAQGRTAAGAGILTAMSVTALGLTALLLPSLGIVGVGVACLVAEVATALALLIRPAWWLPNREPHSAAGDLAVGYAVSSPLA